MVDFDEKSGVVWSSTDWGCWGQTIEEIFIKVDLPENTTSKQVACKTTARSIKCVVNGEVVFEGQTYAVILCDETIWTIEDQKLLNIVLIKSQRKASECWKSLLVDQYSVDPFTFTEMEKKLTLERFQSENPGFDFSGAEISGNYQKGGPTFPTRD